MNNTIYDNRGRTIGYQCSLCNNVVSKMWGTICNHCRSKKEQSNKLLDEMIKLRKEIEDFKQAIKTP